MTIGRAVTLLAGTMVLVSLLLSQLHSPYWLWLTAFVGLNLVQSSFTGFCPAAMIFKVLGGEAWRRLFLEGSPPSSGEKPRRPPRRGFLRLDFRRWVSPCCHAPW